MSHEKPFTVAIESAIAGGSLSILDRGREVATAVGSSAVSNAEEILANIETLLGENAIDLDNVGLIAVSAGPGSFTGIRIGLATALGLRTGLDIVLSSVSALDAMAHDHKADRRDFTVAVPVGRGSICFQQFEGAENGTDRKSGPQVIDAEKFLDAATKGEGLFIVHRSIYDQLPASSSIVDFGFNIAGAIGRVCVSEPGLKTPPLFISKGT